MISRLNPLRGAMIGYGFIASQGHIPGYLKRIAQFGDVEIRAIADISESRRRLAYENLKDKFPQIRVYSHPLVLIQEEKDNLDFVDICTPPYEHANIALEALKQGIHVLCEKPLTVSLEQAELLIQSAFKYKRVVFPCHNYKHAPVVKAIQKIIHNGLIGQVRSVTLNTFRNTHAKGVNEWRPHWRREKEWSGGGITMDHGSHSFYLAFDWMGAYPNSVSAKAFNFNSSLYNTEDNITLVLTFPEGFVHAYLSWTSGVRKVIYTVQGDRGAITVDDDELQLSILDPQGQKIEKQTISSHWMDASHVQWFNSLFDQFKKAIEENDYVSKDTYDALNCILTIVAAYRSAEQGSKDIPLTFGTIGA